MLFVFSDKEEVEKILATEPWSFDKHIVLLQRYEKKVTVRELAFKHVALWIQIHEIPAPYMTREVAEDICGNARIVDKSTQLSEMMGGSFMRVRVVIDVSVPLCRGRMISFDEGDEAWVSFKYVRLPNICYWCGCLNHSDKDCDRWIEGDGSLKDEDKEYGPWIRTTAAALNRKSVVRVPGFFEARKKKKQSVNQWSRAGNSRVALGRSEPPGTVETQQAETEAELAKEFDECINFDEVNSAQPERVTATTNLERDSQERKIKENNEELRRCDLMDNITAAVSAHPVQNQGVTEDQGIRNKKPACKVKESGPCFEVPPRINDHVRPCEVSQEKKPRQRTWKRLSHETPSGGFGECVGAVHATVPAKRNLLENDEGWRDHNKKKKLEVQNESDATTDSMVEAVTQPRQSL